MRARLSTTVTLVPSVANIEAYSMPITPAPTTTIERGTRSRWMIPSEAMIVLSSNATLAGRPGQGRDGVPVLRRLGRAVDLHLAPARQVQDGLAERLGRDRPSVEADAPEHVRALYHGAPPVELRGRDGRLLPARSGADHQH